MLFWLYDVGELRTCSLYAPPGHPHAADAFALQLPLLVHAEARDLVVPDDPEYLLRTLPGGRVVFPPVHARSPLQRAPVVAERGGAGARP